MIGIESLILSWYIRFLSGVHSKSSLVHWVFCLVTCIVFWNYHFEIMKILLTHPTTISSRKSCTSLNWKPHSVLWNCLYKRVDILLYTELKRQIKHKYVSYKDRKILILVKRMVYVSGLIKNNIVEIYWSSQDNSV